MSGTSAGDLSFSPAVKVVISDPARVGEGMAAHITYKVAAEFLRKIEGVDISSVTVLRRFSDFVWLHARLREAVPYAMTPALPEKQALGRMNTDFVDMRHRALQRWMNRVCAHPLLGAAPPLVTFLTLSAEAFAARREAARGEGMREGVKEGGAKLLKFIRSTASTVAAAAASATGSAPAPTSSTKSKSAEDLSFEELEAYLYGQEPLLTRVYNEAATLTSRYREQASQLLEYGSALRALGTSEGGPVGNSLSASGLAVWVASTSAYEQAAEETELVVERLADLVRNMRGVKAAMEERNQASAALAEALSQVERIRATITALGANPTPAGMEKKAQLETTLTQTQNTAAEARVYYDKVAASIISEVERMRASLKTELRDILLDYASIQVRNENKIAAAWERVVGDATTAVAQEHASGGATLISAGGVLGPQ